MAAILFSGGVAFLAIGLLWFYVLRPILEDFGIIVVSDYEEAPVAQQRVMSTPKSTFVQTDKTDRQTDPVFEGDPWLERMKVDRTKTAIIELLVYSGWGVGEIRSMLKGDTGALGVEIEAARKRLGIAPEPPRMIAVRDNGAPPRNIPMDTDYPYKPLEA